MTKLQKKNSTSRLIPLFARRRLVGDRHRSRRSGLSNLSSRPDVTCWRVSLVAGQQAKLGLQAGLFTNASPRGVTRRTIMLPSTDPPHPSTAVAQDHDRPCCDWCDGPARKRVGVVACCCCDAVLLPGRRQPVGLAGLAFQLSPTSGVSAAPASCFDNETGLTDRKLRDRPHQGIVS